MSLRNKKLPQNKLISLNMQVAELFRVVYLNRDGTTTTEQIKLEPATRELHGVRYTRGVPRRTHYMYVGEVVDLTGDVVRIFSEVPVT